MAISPVENNNALSFNERKWYSLFARYPEITFDPDGQYPPKQQDRPPKVPPKDYPPSPISTVPDEGDKSRLSNSTAQTTPLRPLYLVQQHTSSRLDTVAGYLRLVRQTDLPEECRLCFTSLAQSIGGISAGLVPSTNGRYRINNTYFMDQSSVFLRELQVLSSRTKEQLKQIEHLRSLLIFKAEPTDDMLWAMYRQRALLIIRCAQSDTITQHASLTDTRLAAIPSASELRLINHLALLYHAAVYQPMQILYDDDEIEPLTMCIINKHYDLLFTWLAEYRQWCNAMKDLKERYMSPLVQRILSSKSVSDDAKSMQNVKSKAEIALQDPMGPRMLPLDERQLKALNLSIRRKDATIVRRKTRFGRQKTI